METLDVKQSGRAVHPCVIELREMLQSVLGDNFVRLYHYGSRIEGGAEPESDFDVLCVTRRPMSRQEKDTILYRQMDIQMDRDILFDLHFRHEGQTDPTSLLYSPYVDHIVSAGIVV